MAAESRPFLAKERHDVLRDLAANRSLMTQQLVAGSVARALDTSINKLDGKGGALDGTTAVVSFGNISAYVPFCAPYANQKIEHPPMTGKENKEKEKEKEKEQKESKEGKEAKDKEGSKETSDGSKSHGSEVQDPFSRFGEVRELPQEIFDSISRQHPVLLQAAIDRGRAVF